MYLIIADPHGLCLQHAVISLAGPVIVLFDPRLTASLATSHVPCALT
jgi:hypothetical protein